MAGLIALGRIGSRVSREVLRDLPTEGFPDEAHFQNWLQQAAFRKIVDRVRYWRAARRDAGKVSPLETESAVPCSPEVPGARPRQESPSEIVMRGEDLLALEHALAKLPRDHREVVVMHRLLGLSHEEISQNMGRTEEATRALLLRAMTGLQKLLRDRASR